MNRRIASTALFALGLAFFSSPAVAQVCPGDDIHEPNQTCATAVALTGGTTPNLAILGTNHDMWSWVVPPGGDLVIDVLFLHANGNIDVKLVTADCNNLIDSGYSTDDNEHVTGHNSGTTAVTMVLHAFGVGSSFTCNDYTLQVMVGQPNAQAYCFANPGNPSGNFCPCGNDNDGTLPAGGCRHDDSSAGARLDVSGSASVTGDTLLLVGSRGPNADSTLFFQANNDLDGTASFLGDGIRCAGGGLIRLKVKTTDGAGNADSSPMVISVRSATFGHVIVPGETLYYQWWIRDPGGSPCGTESNTSNGYEVTWSA